MSGRWVHGDPTDPTPDLATPLTARTAPVIDDFIEDATPEMRRGWEAAIKATLDAARQPVAETALRRRVAALASSSMPREWNCAVHAALLVLDGEGWQEALDAHAHAALATREPDPAPLIDFVLAPGWAADRPSGPRTEKGHVLASSLRRRLPDADIDYDEWVRDIELQAVSAALATREPDPDPLDVLPKFEVGQVVGDLQPGRRRHDWCSIHGDIGPMESIDAHARRAHGASSEAIRKARKTLKAVLAHSKDEP